MFSTLARGSCNWDGRLKFDEEIFCDFNRNQDDHVVDESRSTTTSSALLSSSRRIKKVRSSASSTLFYRERSALTSVSCGNTELRANELVLPKTYITREGHLVLFAVIDNDLFALVNSAEDFSKKSSKQPRLFNENVELLSQFGSLEEFVISILHYNHKKEKYLYAQANKMVSRITQQLQRKSFIKKRLVSYAVNQNDEKEKVQQGTQENQKFEDQHKNYDKKVTVGSSRISCSSIHGKNNVELGSVFNDDNEATEFVRLSLAPSRAVDRGKLRSPLLTRKASPFRKTDEMQPKEYVSFNMALNQQAQNSSKRSMFGSDYGINITGEHPSSELDSQFGMEYDQGLVPQSVKNLIKNVPQAQGYFQTDDNSSNFLTSTVRMQRRRTTSPSYRPNSVEGKNVLPFMFDGKIGNSIQQTSIDKARKPSANQKQQRIGSSSWKDLENVNLHPRISSSKPAPEIRALGVTPSAIAFTSDEFLRLLEVNSTNELSVNIPIPNETANLNRTNIDDISNTNSNQLVQTFDKLNDRLQTSQGNSNDQNSDSISDIDSIIREGSVLSIGEANRRMGVESDRLLSREISNNLLFGDDTEDDEILFSYISPSLRQGSWNPEISFSTQGQDETCSDIESSKGTELGRWNTSSESEQILSGNVDINDNESYSESYGISYVSLKRDGSTMEKSATESLKSAQLHTLGDGTIDYNDSSIRPAGSDKRSQQGFTSTSRQSSLFRGNVESLGNFPSARSTSTRRTDEDRHQDGKNEYENKLTSEELNPEEFEGISNYARSEILQSADLHKDENQFTDKGTPSQETSINDKTLPSQSSVGIRSPELEYNKSLEQRRSTFDSDAATNVSIRDSIRDAKMIEQPGVKFTGLSSAGSQIDASEHDEDKMLVDANNFDKHSMPAASFSSDQNRDEISTTMPLNQYSDTQRKIGDNKTLIKSSADVDEFLRENVISTGLNIERNGRKQADPIREDSNANRERVFVESSIFGTQQLLKSQTAKVKNEIDDERSRKKLEFPYNHNGNLSYEKELVIGKREDLNKDTAVHDKTMVLSKNVVKSTNKPVSKVEKQTVELKIDLKVEEESSPENGASDLGKPVSFNTHIGEKNAQNRKESLRLDGLGGEETKKDDNTLDELKLLLQKNQEDTQKAKKKQADRAPIKRPTQKPKKKKTTSQKSDAPKKSNDSKNLSPVLDLPKKMATVETMIGMPKEAEIIPKIIPDTEPKVMNENETADENYRSDENKAEAIQPVSKRKVRIKTMEVKKVSAIDPKKKGAYPPSKTKRGVKQPARKNESAKEKPEEKLQYEEQMKLLKEKEIEQQRARETAMAKQKAIEEEREKYKEEEEEAVKKEIEARNKLAETKLKAKEEREAKRQADADKRRLMVEQRREERKQKEVELAEKEKAAERLKYERERRATEIKDQRERLKEQERVEEEEILERERLYALKMEEEEKKLEEERIRMAQDELERLIEEREYREQLRRVAEAQEEKLRQLEEKRHLEEQQQQKNIEEERERLKRIEYMKLQAELERQKESDRLADEKRKQALLRSAKRKAQLLNRREDNLERMFDLKCKRTAQSISRSFTFTYFVHIPRHVWEVPIGWSKKKNTKGSTRGKNRPISVSTGAPSSK